jgi:hypothetical protein
MLDFEQYFRFIGAEEMRGRERLFLEKYALLQRNRRNWHNQRNRRDRRTKPVPAAFSPRTGPSF